MEHKPKIPLHPSELPQQKLVVVVDLPARPPGFEYQVGWGEFAGDVIPKRGTPRAPIYLAQFEWADTPMNNGIEAFYLEPRKKYWLLWVRTHDDNSIPWKWDWLPVGFCPRGGISQEVAASHLLLEYWRFVGKQTDSESPFHWINQVGALSVSDILAITRELNK